MIDRPVSDEFVVHYEACRAHFKDACLDRFDLELDSLQINTINAAIEHQLIKNEVVARFVARMRPPRSLWEVIYQGQVMLVVYDEVQRVPVTVLPKTDPRYRQYLQPLRFMLS